MGLNDQPSIDENDLPSLSVEVEESNKSYSLHGRRVVNINPFINALMRLGNHGKMCTMGYYKLENETRVGLGFVLKFHCATCDRIQFVSSEGTNDFDELNNTSVWAALWIGIGYKQFSDLLSVQDIPAPSEDKFRKHEIIVGKVGIYIIFLYIS